MSVTHPTTSFATTRRAPTPPDRQQLMPFLIGMAIVAVTVALALAVTGLPQ
jgi:hypothetical protein